MVPEALVLDDLGRLFVLDREENAIFRLAETDWIAFSAGGQGAQRSAIISRLDVLGPDLFALDPVGLVLYRFDLEGRLKSPISLGRSLAVAGIDRVDAVDFAMTKSGELLLLDRAGRRLLLFDRFGVFVTDLAEGASGRERFRSPLELTLDGSGEIYVLDPPDRSVRRFSRQGEARPPWRYDGGLSGDAARGRHVAATPWGQIVVAAEDGSWIRVFAADGLLLAAEEFPERAGRTLADLVAGPDSVLYLAEPEKGEIGRLGLTYPDALPATRR